MPAVTETMQVDKVWIEATPLESPLETGSSIAGS